MVALSRCNYHRCGWQQVRWTLLPSCGPTYKDLLHGFEKLSLASICFLSSPRVQDVFHEARHYGSIAVTHCIRLARKETTPS